MKDVLKKVRKNRSNNLKKENNNLPRCCYQYHMNIMCSPLFSTASHSKYKPPNACMSMPILPSNENLLPTC